MTKRDLALAFISGLILSNGVVSLVITLVSLVTGAAIPAYMLYCNLFALGFIAGLIKNR
jgi:hypothetical protein